MKGERRAAKRVVEIPLFWSAQWMVIERMKYRIDAATSVPGYREAVKRTCLISAGFAKFYGGLTAENS